ncbi:hypothetical protein BOSEA31B_14525 [Hyphomicrobiales bacterium]|nr:hypothetical protein BOSEA31B_14525 [Hyphomicrobiales bacterium]CAH1700300.1 hypothetical protein BOSEA1005_13353 [Hyphomicrobiales bacterium]CAI0344079.1 hypothetical protein BO1005MUT1_310108 [Hyphomicrobiales bacterium]
MVAASFVVIARSVSDEAIQRDWAEAFRPVPLDCFASLAMTALQHHIAVSSPLRLAPAAKLRMIRYTRL